MKKLTKKETKELKNTMKQLEKNHNKLDQTEDDKFNKQVEKEALHGLRHLID